VFSNWKFHSKLMAQGSGNFIKMAGLYFLFAGIPVFLRRRMEKSSFVYMPVDLESPFSEKFDHEPPRRRGPFGPVAFFLILGAMFLPHQPWRHLTSTLLYDVIGTISSVMLSRSLHDRAECSGPDASIIGTHPLAGSLYNPTKDPYYISNLDQPVDSFIAQALEGIQFTNVVHIVLESVRADCFPFQEDGLLNEYIQTKLSPNQDESITTQTITPFISSLAKNIISWDTVWATIPFTHKSMLGCILRFLCR